MQEVIQCLSCDGTASWWFTWQWCRKFWIAKWFRRLKIEGNTGWHKRHRTWNQLGYCTATHFFALF